MKIYSFECQKKAKSALAEVLNTEMENIGIEKDTLALIFGIDEDDVEHIKQGMVDAFDIFDIMRFINYLGRDIHINVYPANKRRGNIHVCSMDIRDDDSDRFLKDGKLETIAII